MAKVIKPEKKLNLSAVSGLQRDLLAIRDGDVSVEMQDVTHLGALCAQLMIAAGRLAQAEGHQFEMMNTSDQVIDQLALMGMTPQTIAEGLQ